MWSSRDAIWMEWKAKEIRYTSWEKGARTAIPSPENLTPSLTEDGQPPNDTREEGKVELREMASPPMCRYRTHPARDTSELRGKEGEGEQRSREGGVGENERGREGERREGEREKARKQK